MVQVAVQVVAEGKVVVKVVAEVVVTVERVAGMSCDTRSSFPLNYGCCTHRLSQVRKRPRCSTRSHDNHHHAELILLENTSNRSLLE